MNEETRAAPPFYVSPEVWEALLNVTTEEPLQELTLFVQRDDEGGSPILAYELGAYVPVVLVSSTQFMYGIVLEVDLKRSAVTLVI